MPEKPRPKKRVRTGDMATEHKRITRKRRTRRPLGLGEMAQHKFPFIAVVNGETMIVNRIGDRITFTPWI